MMSPELSRWIIANGSEEFRQALAKLMSTIADNAALIERANRRYLDASIAEIERHANGGTP